MSNLMCLYCGENMMHATDGKYEYGWCPFCFSQSPAVKRVVINKESEEYQNYTVSIATGMRATIEEAAVSCVNRKSEDI